jgi:hypothetical protein
MKATHTLYNPCLLLGHKLDNLIYTVNILVLLRLEWDYGVDRQRLLRAQI